MGALTVKTSRRAFVPLVILTILPACTQMRVTSTMPLRRPYSSAFHVPRPNISMTSTDRSPLPQFMGLAEPAGDNMVVPEASGTAKTLVVLGFYAGYVLLTTVDWDWEPPRRARRSVDPARVPEGSPQLGAAALGEEVRSPRNWSCLGGVICSAYPATTLLPSGQMLGPKLRFTTRFPI